MIREAVMNRNNGLCISRITWSTGSVRWFEQTVKGNIFLMVDHRSPLRAECWGARTGETTNHDYYYPKRFDSSTGKAVGATRSTSFWQTVWKNIRISTASVVSKPMIVLIAWNRFFFVAKHQSKTVKKRYTDSTVSTLKLNEGMDFHAHWERGWRTTSSGSLLSTD